MKTDICQHCKRSFEHNGYSTTGKFCSNQCNGLAKREHSRTRFLAGERMERSTQRRFVIERDGYQCQKCKNAEWLGEPIPLQLDHTDGNPANDLPDNLRMLCCNCHAMTPSYGAKNKGSGRKARGLPTR